MRHTKPFASEEEYWDYIAAVKRRKLTPPTPKRQPRTNSLRNADLSKRENEEALIGKSIPSPEQIEEACLEIQNSWGPIERTRRMRNSGLLAPRVTVTETYFTPSNGINSEY